jgi:hypothetical protein
MPPGAQSSNNFAADQSPFPAFVVKIPTPPCLNTRMTIERGILTVTSPWTSMDAAIMIRPKSQGLK